MKKILICDDEVDMRDVLEMLIGIEFDIEVHHAENGLKGIEKLATDIEFDLIICDMNMPKAKGVEVYNYNKKNKNFPFILISGDCEKDIKILEGFGSDSAAISVNKPWKGDELLDTIRPILLDSAS